jgi:hypothetical protein
MTTVFTGVTGVLVATLLSPRAFVVLAFVLQKHCATRVDAYVPAYGGSSGRASFHASYAWFSMQRKCRSRQATCLTSLASWLLGWHTNRLVEAT